MNNRWTEGQYGVFRALLGAYLFVHFTHLLGWGGEVFSRAGMLPNAQTSPLFGLIPNVLAISDAPAAITALLGAGALAAVAFSTGRHDKLAALVMWYVLACLFARNPLIANPALPYLGWMLIAHLFISTAPWLARDTRPRIDLEAARRMPPSIHLAAWVVLALSYSYSGYTKLLSPSWVSGDTVWYVLHNPLARDYFLRDFMLWLGDDAVRAVTWTVLWVELLFAPLALSRHLRPILWGVMLVVQIGFLCLLNFADLTTPMLLFHLLTFDPAWVNATRARSAETVFFDGRCGFCHAVVQFTLAEDHAGHFRFAPLQGAKFRAALSAGVRDTLPDSFVIIDDRGRLLVKSDAVVHLLGRLGGLWRVLGCALRIVPRPLRDLGYDCVGRVRHRLFAQPEAMCPIVPAAMQARLHP